MSFSVRSIASQSVAAGFQDTVTSFVARSAFTDATPCTRPTSRSIVATQCPQLMFGTFTVLFVMIVFLFSRSRYSSRPSRGLEDLEQLAQHTLASRRIGSAHGVRHTRVQVMVEEQPADLLQRSLDPRDLVHDVDAVFAVLDHALDTPHVSLDALQSPQDVRGPVLGHRFAPWIREPT